MVTSSPRAMVEAKVGNAKKEPKRVTEYVRRARRFRRWRSRRERLRRLPAGGQGGRSRGRRAFSNIHQGLRVGRLSCKLEPVARSADGRPFAAHCLGGSKSYRWYGGSAGCGRTRASARRCCTGLDDLWCPLRMLLLQTNNSASTYTPKRDGRVRTRTEAKTTTSHINEHAWRRRPSRAAAGACK